MLKRPSKSIFIGLEDVSEIFYRRASLIDCVYLKYVWALMPVYRYIEKQLEKYTTN